jgi:hypothetical protein
MPDGSGAAVKITILPDSSEKSFRVEGMPGSLEFGTASNFDQVIASRQGLPAELDRLKDAVGGKLSLDWETANRAVAELYSIGLLTLRTLLDDVFSVSRLRRFFEGALRPLLAAGVTPIVEVSSPRGGMLPMIVPVELFPVLMQQSPRKITNLAELTAVLDGILGFSTVIGRQVGGVASAQPLRRSRALPVKLFQYTGLANSRAEIAFFTSNADKFETDGPWPGESPLTRPGVRFLAEQVMDPTRRFDGTARDPPDQVQHFACHCDTLDPNPLEHNFTLQSDGAGRVDIALRDLMFQQMEIAQLTESRPCPMPLVFFNACGTAVFDPRGVGSFVTFFLQNGNRGFIGTQTPVPDVFASHFCEPFYSQLLEGETVGAALLAARRKMVERYRNPLGILYSHYGRPELRLVDIAA